MDKIRDYERLQEQTQQRAARMFESERYIYGKAQDTTPLATIRDGLNTINAISGGSEPVKTWAEAAWRLALDMFGGNQ